MNTIVSSVCESLHNFNQASATKFQNEPLGTAFSQAAGVVFAVAAAKYTSLSMQKTALLVLSPFIALQGASLVEPSLCGTQSDVSLNQIYPMITVLKNADASKAPEFLASVLESVVDLVQPFSTSVQNVAHNVHELAGQVWAKGEEEVAQVLSYFNPSNTTESQDPKSAAKSTQTQTQSNSDAQEKTIERQAKSDL